MASQASIKKRRGTADVSSYSWQRNGRGGITVQTDGIPWLSVQRQCQGIPQWFGRSDDRLPGKGKTVNVPFLGSFKLSIETDSEIHPDTGRSMRNIVVRGVNFQPAQELMNAIGKPSFQWKFKTGVTIVPTTVQLAPPSSSSTSRLSTASPAKNSSAPSTWSSPPPICVWRNWRERSDTDYWERKGEKVCEKINMTPICKQSRIQINVSSSNLGLRIKKNSRRIIYRSYEQYIQGRLLIIER